MSINRNRLNSVTRTLRLVFTSRRLRLIQGLLAACCFFFFPSPSGHAQSTPTVTNLHSFNYDDGNNPRAPLIQAADGNFYGTTYGNGSGGTVFKITTTGALTTLHAFDGNTDGGALSGGLLQGSDGNFYGTILQGPSTGKGAIFRLTPAGAYSVIHAFGGTDGDGPSGTLVDGHNGFFYGTTTLGGTANRGTVFRVTPHGDHDVLVNVISEGSLPSGLIRDSAGNLFTATYQGGFLGSNVYQGVIFRVAPGGEVSRLHGFTGGDDGRNPTGPLVIGPEGSFHGVTFLGGSSEMGTVFRVTAAGVLTPLHAFKGDDGAGPIGGLLLARDGFFYGLTQSGGKHDTGTIFRIGGDGALLTLFSFDSAGENNVNSTGANPRASLVQSSDGALYGTTDLGGTSGAGSIFRLNLPLPVITSTLSAAATAGQAFNYQIAATNTPTNFATTGLPAGLGTSTNTGKILGTPTRAGVYHVTLKAANLYGAGSAVLKLTITGAPVITSATAVSGKVGVAFTYQIAASFNPTSYGATGLPDGISINRSTGRISGTPTQAGTFPVTVTAFNNAGSGSEKVTVTVKPPAPVITSALNPPSRQGVAFAYQITAANTPVSYGAAGLPGGLTINQATGKITGRPTKAGTYSVTIAAFNSGGNGTATLMLVVKPPA